MITFSHVSKTFDGDEYAVNDVSFEIATGETVVILGSSGSGKTTTLKMINRLIEPSSGFIEIDGKNITTMNPIELRRSIGYVFQEIGLFPHLTVEENIGLVLRLNHVPKARRRKQVFDVLQLVNLSPEIFFSRYPDELSGGQQQRIGVARALVTQPNVLLMDEPFGALDAINREALQQELISLKQHLQKTILFVTHDIFEALRLGDQIAIMHEGRLEQIGTKHDILHTPATPYVQQLFQNSVRQLQEYLSLINE